MQVNNTSDRQTKVYFPNLNALRFIAASLVIVHHIEQIKSISGIENYWQTVPFIGIIGKLGVVLFFVLSGFLITYLLLTEEYVYKKISIKKFYIRRILRIWPLYFLIIVLAFFVLPNIKLFTLPGFGKEIIYTHLWLKLFLYAIFFPNLVLTVFGVVPYASHTWSIGTEEQYYLVWPIILKRFKKHRILLMVFIILSYLVIEKILSTHYSNILPMKSVLQGFWSSFNIDCMAIGGIYAILLFQKSKVLKFLMNPLMFYLVIILVIFLMVKGVYIPYVHYEAYSVLFGIIILNLAANDRIKISLENKLSNYLGNISYGLYMYHPIVIVLALKIAGSTKFTTNWLLYPLTLLMTIAVAGLSYRYFETFFLKFKNRFSNIISGNEITAKKGAPANLN